VSSQRWAWPRPTGNGWCAACNGPGAGPGLSCWFGVEPPAGIEPATPSLPWNHRVPLCGPPFPQLAPDRSRRSYRFSFGQVMRSRSSQPLIVSHAGIIPASDMSPGTASLLHPGIYPTDVPPPRYRSRSISTFHSLPSRPGTEAVGNLLLGRLHDLPSAPRGTRPPKERAPVVGATSRSSASAGSPGRSLITGRVALTAPYRVHLPLGCQGVRPPVPIPIEGRGACHLLEIAAIRVGGVDACPAGAWGSCREQRHDDLRAVRRPVGVLQP
jgi:hypothetical protein